MIEAVLFCEVIDQSWIAAGRTLSTIGLILLIAGAGTQLWRLSARLHGRT